MEPPALRRRTSLAWTILIALLPLSCASPRDYALLTAAKRDLIGLSQTDIEMCAGFASATRERGSSEIWSYTYRKNQAGLTIGVPAVYGAVNTAVSIPTGGECKMQVRFVEGRVVEVAYAGSNDTAQGRDLLCATLVDGCVAYARENPRRIGSYARTTFDPPAPGTAPAEGSRDGREADGAEPGS